MAEMIQSPLSWGEWEWGPDPKNRFRTVRLNPRTGEKLTRKELRAMEQVSRNQREQARSDRAFGRRQWLKNLPSSFVDWAREDKTRGNIKAVQAIDPLDQNSWKGDIPGRLSEKELKRFTNRNNRTFKSLYHLNQAKEQLIQKDINPSGSGLANIPAGDPDGTLAAQLVRKQLSENRLGSLTKENQSERIEYQAETKKRALETKSKNIPSEFSGSAELSKPTHEWRGQEYTPFIKGKDGKNVYKEKHGDYQTSKGYFRQENVHGPTKFTAWDQKYNPQAPTVEPKPTSQQMLERGNIWKNLPKSQTDNMLSFGESLELMKTKPGKSGGSKVSTKAKQAGISMAGDLLKKAIEGEDAYFIPFRNQPVDTSLIGESWDTDFFSPL